MPIDYNSVAATTTIQRVIAIIQRMRPDARIGSYVSHVPAENGGAMVQLKNGKILVTIEAIQDVNNSQNVPGYADAMVKTFEKTL